MPAHCYAINYTNWNAAAFRQNISHVKQYAILSNNMEIARDHKLGLYDVI